jgi:branched-chain amino acid transport system substrate-binding protein
MTKSWQQSTVWLGVLLMSGLSVAPALAQECEVKIGVASAVTGGAAPWGLAVKAGAEFQAALMNEAGGLQLGTRKCKIRVLPIDGQCTAAGGAAASNYFASEKVHVVLGPTCSPETTGFQPLSKRHGQLYMSSSYKQDVIGTEWPLGFHQVQGPMVYGPVLIKAAKERFVFKTVVVLGPNDQGGTDAGKQLSKMYTDAGIKSTEEWYQRGTTNFAPLVARVMALNVDVVELAGMGPGDVTILVKQLMEAGYKGLLGGLGGIGMNPVV